MDGYVPKPVRTFLVLTNVLMTLMGIVVLGFGVAAYMDGKDVAQLVYYGETYNNGHTPHAGNMNGYDHGGSGGGGGFWRHHWSMPSYLFIIASILLIAFSVLSILTAIFGVSSTRLDDRQVYGGRFFEGQYYRRFFESCYNRYTFSDSPGLLWCYYVLLLVTFAGTLIGATIALTQYFRIDYDALYESMRFYNHKRSDDRHMDVSKAWDNLQETHECCGVQGYADWNQFNFPGNKAKVPDSCCVPFTAVQAEYGSFEDCIENPNNYRYRDHMKGCYHALRGNMDISKMNIGIVAGIYALFMLANFCAFFWFTMWANPNKGGYHVFNKFHQQQGGYIEGPYSRQGSRMSGQYGYPNESTPINQAQWTPVNSQGRPQQDARYGMY